MKIRSQLILGAAVFGIVLLVIGASVVTTTAEHDRLEQQAQVADRVGVAASDLNYLANEYLLYGEPQQARPVGGARRGARGGPGQPLRRDAGPAGAGRGDHEGPAAAEDRLRRDRGGPRGRSGVPPPIPPRCRSRGAGSGSRPRGSRTTPRASRTS